MEKLCLKILTIAWFCLALIGCTINQTHPYHNTPAPQADGRLKAKAYHYDQWNQQQFLQPYGGISNRIKFAKTHLEEEKVRNFSQQTTLFSDVKQYGALGDSAIWTSLYLASQAYRYKTTGEAQAKKNVELATLALDHFLRITNHGVIARFAGPRTPIYLQSVGKVCDVDAHYCISTTFKDSPAFWLSKTTRDQYTGWFFGMSMAYDVLEDEKYQRMIKEDMTTVIKQLAKDNFVIRPKKGQLAGVARWPSALQKISWATAAAAITQDPDIIAIRDKIIKVNHFKFSIERFGKHWGANRYGGYVGYNLSHINFYNLIRLEENKALRDRYLAAYTQMYAWVENDGIPFFDYVQMALNKPEKRKQTLAWAALVEFPNFPHVAKDIYPPKADIDFLSVNLNRLNRVINSVFSMDKILIHPEAKTPYPIRHRCIKNFLWQQSPYKICCTEPSDDNLWDHAQLQGKCYQSVQNDEYYQVYAGIDYLLAYWMGRYYHFLPDRA